MGAILASFCVRLATEISNDVLCCVETSRLGEVLGKRSRVEDEEDEG